ncbi:MAG: phospholipid carrier-dependent glycosyltransferase [Deltaproteobacteria bacterium]|nr:phospholipid carrier-dependent glycosyltransferase [Deltaproteobacteria bacterium]
MGSFFYATREGRGAKHRLWMALFGGFCGLAFLVKGFLAFAVPVVTVVPFMLWERRMNRVLKASWIPILAAVLVVLPWALMIHLREGDFWNYFFWTEHISRFLSPIPGQHPKPFWYFIPVLIGGLLPWVALMPAAVMGVGRRWRQDAFIRFLFCWFFFPFLFFSASSGKLIPYILPCFPRW